MYGLASSRMTSTSTSWTGEVAEEGDVGEAIGNAIADYRTKSGKTIWGVSIMVDKARLRPRR